MFHDLLADLPAPRDDEPSFLRDDIHDELADHLHCALRRELLKDRDETTAEQRVLNRFGDPRKLARRLWWQAMWSRIMTQRILSGLQWMLTLAAVFLAGAVFWQQLTLLEEIRTARQEDAAERSALTALLNHIRKPVSPESAVPTIQAAPFLSEAMPGEETDIGGTGGRSRPYPRESADDPVELLPQKPEQEPQSLTVKLVQEAANGPPVVDAQLTLEVRHRHIAAEQLREPVAVNRLEDGKEIPDVAARATGAYVFQVEQPDRYELKIQLPHGQECEQSVLVRPNEHRELTVICPKPREQAMVTLTAPPLPKELQDLKCELELVLNDSFTTIDGIEWRATSARYPSVTFDPEGGPAVEIRDGWTRDTTNLRRSKSSERAVVILAGPVQYGYNIAPRLEAVGMTTVAAWPPNGPSLTHVITPGENQWELELPDRLLEEAERVFVNPGRSYYPVQESALAPASAQVPATVVEPAGNLPQDSTPDVDAQPSLIVKLVEGTADGPPVLGAKAILNSSSGYVEFREETRPPEFKDKDGIPQAEAFCTFKGNRIEFPGLEPNHYSLELTLKDGQYSTRHVLIRDDKPRELTIICPKTREKAPVVMTVTALPDDLRQADFRVWCLLSSSPLELGNDKWERKKWGTDQRPSNPIDFEASGRPQFIDHTEFSPETPVEDRVAFLPQGPTRIRIKIYQEGERVDLWATADWPKLAGDDVNRTVKAGENRWELELSEEMIAAARKQLAAKDVRKPKSESE